ncbi:sterol desaturase family protein [Sediminibacterium soli]|uniref:sterol desaturase family protein n=1 Tax=Sediminibacterium soli TaxID=2698829 RepID=UPI00137B13AB|nr:sterol desaturase family protein [Sediminibacterium soli]NCI47884.1 sterol desaturase family protein [Sediminibacterium soli]
MDLKTFVYLLLDNAGRYFFVAAPVFFLFYVLLRKRIAGKKIQLRFPGLSDYAREILYSTLSIIIFSIPPLLMLYSPVIRPYTRFYTDINEYGWTYLVAAFPLLFLLHDTYFYWTHRLIHHPLLFRRVHLVHHRSTNPSPWAAYAFSPSEALLNSLIFVVFLLAIPVHSIHLMVFFVVSLVYNVYGHLGFELYPKGFNRHWLGRWINTSVSHNQHHRHFRGNYGLYFTFWDRLMGTLRTDYDAAFDNLKSRSREPAG